MCIYYRRFITAVGFDNVLLTEVDWDEHIALLHSSSCVEVAEGAQLNNIAMADLYLGICGTSATSFIRL